MALLGSATALAQTAPQTEIQGQKEAEAPEIDMTKAWPCVQRRVENVSVGQIWDGPPIEGIKGWYRDHDLVDLIDYISSRRVNVDDAEKAIKKYAEGIPEADRDAKMTTLFAAAFDKFTNQRRQVMSGILKYQSSQQARAIELEKQSTAISDLESKRPAGVYDDTPEIADAREKFNWAQRIFQERQSNIPLACELPVLIEERLYAVARAIRGEMKS